MMRSMTCALALLALVASAAADCTGHAAGSPGRETCCSSLSSNWLTAAELGKAEKYVVFAGSAVTSTGASVLNGWIGVSPGIAVTFSTGTLTGGMNVGDADAAVAIGGAGDRVADGAVPSITTAYFDLKGRAPAPGCAKVLAGNLAGMTLTEGLYTAATALSIVSGTLTLDGDANSVFIFQMGTTFMSSNGHVLLTGGALARNVFWQVGSAGTLGAGCVLEGTMIADQAISAAIGAVVNGRVFARIAAMTMIEGIFALPV